MKQQLPARVSEPTLTLPRQEQSQSTVVAIPDWNMDHVMTRVRSTMPNMTDNEANVALDTYREYMREIKVNPKRKMQPPSRLVDTIWHTHIFLCTRTYMADCERYFGGYLHHAAICDAGGCDHGGEFTPTHVHLVGSGEVIN
jgi:hypothetical protein